MQIMLSSKSVSKHFLPIVLSILAIATCRRVRISVRSDFANVFDLMIH